jgi:hypothetical protein
MRNRIFALTGYLSRSFAFSLSGLLYALAALAFFLVFFSPGQRTPDADYFTLMLGGFGGALSFLSTLSVAAVANRVESYSLLARLPSRIEYLAAILFSSVSFATLFQLVMALLAWQLGGVDMTVGRALDIPPLWLALNILMSVLALHASDFVAAGWSRAILYGMLLVLLFVQNYGAELGSWFGARFGNLSSWFLMRGWLEVATQAQAAANWFYGDGGARFGELLAIPFWPFLTVLDGVIAGVFRGLEGLAPAVLLLYATILFLLASGLLADKDLMLVE